MPRSHVTSEFPSQVIGFNQTDRHDSRPVFAFELPETAAVDYARYDISYIECLTNVSANDTVQFVSRVQRRICRQWRLAFCVR